MIDMMDVAINQGFSACVVIYLLYERSKFNRYILETLKEISVVIKERMPRSV